MKRIIVFLIIVIGISGCKSNMVEEENNIQIEDFFNKINNQKYSEAIEHFLSLNENINFKDSATLDLLNKFDLMNSVSGKYIDKKLILKRNVTDNIFIYSYLVIYEKNFYRFIFVFYNNGERSLPYKFLFDDSMDLELEESLKLYYNTNI